MAARLEVRSEGDHEWVVLVGGNGEVMMTTETYPAGHGNAERAAARLRAVWATEVSDIVDGRP